MKKKGNITYSIAFKVFLYILLVVSFLTGAASAAAGLYMAESDVYSVSSYEELLYERLESAAYNHLDYICYDKESFPTLESMRRAFEQESEAYGIGFSIRHGSYFWSNCTDKDTPYVYETSLIDRLGEQTGNTSDMFSVYVYDTFPKQDEFREIERITRYGYNYRYDVLYGAAVGILLFVISFIWLICNAGRARGQEGIVPSVLTPIPLDLLALVFGTAAVVPFIMFYYEAGWDLFTAVAAVLLGSFETVWCTIFCRELALRMKLGKWWRNSLVYMALRLIWRVLKALGRGALALLRGLPSIFHVAAAILFLSGCEFIGLMIWEWDDMLLICWFFEKLIVIPLLLYCALAFKKLQDGSKSLAEGNLTHKLDTRYLLLDFKDHGDNLNKIGEGISRAVEQKMQSERLKTELITNVSHDLKTPLTSIINYADLLGSEAGKEDSVLDRGRIAEYSEVLLRQSQRLKKLLDDLMEASKATTGSLEVNLAPCELGVLLTQAAGEYEARFAGQDLKLHISRPEEEIRIMADGRHLWRVFENLLNNICKYAQEGSRVYLNVERKGSRAEVIFRNMSKYELNISAQELEERFVRGDKSRHMEGNGLGLSIAKSLVELQNGEMKIVTDGDLFKVVLDFEVMEE